MEEDMKKLNIMEDTVSSRGLGSRVDYRVSGPLRVLGLWSILKLADKQTSIETILQDCKYWQGFPLIEHLKTFCCSFKIMTKVNKVVFNEDGSIRNLKCEIILQPTGLEFKCQHFCS